MSTVFISFLFLLFPPPHSPVSLIPSRVHAFFIIVTDICNTHMHKYYLLSPFSVIHMYVYLGITS